MKILTTLFLLMAFSNLHAQTAPPVYWEWTKNYSAVNFSNKISELQAFENYLYGIGTFNNSTFTLDTTTLINSGGNDIYIAKWDTMGNIIWITPINGASNEFASNFTFDSSGHLIIGLQSDSPFVQADTFNLTSNGLNDIYIGKVDTGDGHFTWMQNFGDAGDNFLRSICVDALENIFISGNLNGQNGIHKYTSNGTWLFTKLMNFTANVIKYSNYDSSIVAAGSFNSTLLVGNDSLAFISPGSSIPYPGNAFIFKMKLNGNNQWLKNISNYFQGESVGALEIRENDGRIYYLHSNRAGAIGGGSRVARLAYIENNGSSHVDFFTLYFAGYQSNYWANHMSINESKNKLVLSMATGPGSFSQLERKLFIYDLNTDAITSTLDYTGLNNAPDILAPHTMLNKGIYAGGDIVNLHNLGKINGALLSINGGINNVHICDSANIFLQADAHFGTPPYTFLWSPALGLDSTNTQNTTGFVNSPRIYTLTATDASSVTMTQTIAYFIDATQQPIITASSTTLCTNPIQLSANFNLNNGVNGKWYYFNINTNTYDFFSYANTISTVTIQDFILRRTYTGCSFDDSIHFNGPNQVPANVSIYPSGPICSGGIATISISPSANYIISGGVIEGIPFVPNGSTYTVTLLDSNGCYSVFQTININMFATGMGESVQYQTSSYTSPSYSTASPPIIANICNGDSITLRVTGALSFLSYVWSGGIQDNVGFIPTSSTIYLATIINNDVGCTKIMPVEVNLVGCPLNVSNPSEEPRLYTISPNPFQSEFNISIQSNSNCQKDFILTDVYGKTIFTYKNKAVQKGKNEFIFSVGKQLAKGIYFLGIQNKEEKQTFKLLKE